MSNIYAKLKSLEAVSGNALKVLATTYLSDSTPDGDEFRRYVMAVLDPAVTYGVSAMPSATHIAQHWFGESAFDILDRLAVNPKTGKRNLSGNEAKDVLTGFARNHCAEGCETMQRALKKDLRCGLGINTINSLGLPFKIPVFACQLATPGEAKLMKDSEDWLGSIKFDGIRSLIRVADKDVSFWTRSGKPIPALEPLIPAVLEVFGGMRVMLDSEGVGTDFLDSVSQLRKKSGVDLKDTTTLQIFDMLDLDEFVAADEKTAFGNPLTERLADLEHILGNGTDALYCVEHSPVSSWVDAELMAGRWMDEGLEGGILKKADSRYTKRRTKDWLKIKLEDPQTVRVLDIYVAEADKKYAGMLGGAIVAVGGTETRSRVGGGWSDWERAAIMAAHTGQTVGGVAPDPANLITNRLMDIVSNGANPSGALRHARKKRFRDIEGEIA